MKYFFLIITLVLMSLKLVQAQEFNGGIKEGEKAPSIVTSDIFGNPINLEKLSKTKPVVVVFYRGSWCPYCNVYLASLVKRLDEIQEKAEIIAITPQQPDHIDETIKLRNIKFPIIYDENAEIIKDWKSVSREERVGVLKTNQYDNQILPVPATYVVSQEGVVTKRHFDENFKVRMDVDELIAELDRLNKAM